MSNWLPSYQHIKHVVDNHDNLRVDTAEKSDLFRGHGCFSAVSSSAPTHHEPMLAAREEPMQLAAALVALKSQKWSLHTHTCLSL